VERTEPYQYKAVFSPADVLEEYTRPARLMRGGEIVILAALSELEHIHFPGLGTLEAFNTDGLRTLLKTLPIQDMTEKTLRYPGHARLMEIFRDSGFFSPEPVQIDGHSITPLSLTSRLLFKEWHLETGKKDLTVMKVILTGTKYQKKTAVQFDLLDHYDPEQGVTSMARTTGYTCSIIARQMLEGMIPETGICPPEYIGRHPDCYQDLLENLAARGIHLKQSIPD
jgi:saccharopine dehydrogenase-like NADP-dependent oxidoreductase